MQYPADVKLGLRRYRHQQERRRAILAKAKAGPSATRTASGANAKKRETGASAGASDPPEKASRQSRRPIKKYVESSTSSFTFSGSTHRLPNTQIESTHRNNRKAGPHPKSHSSPPGPQMLRNTARPSLTAAVQEAPPLVKALFPDHCHPRPERARKLPTAKRSETMQSRRNPIIISPHNEHSGQIVKKTPLELI